jgi:hypothetical protein
VTDWLRVFLIFSSLIWIPLIWIILRGEKAGDQEGSYTEPQRMHPDWRSDDPLESGIPGAEVPVFGPTRSTPAAYMDFQTLKHGWTHRDITYYINRFLKGKRKSARAEKEESKPNS